MILEEMRHKFNIINQFCRINTPLYFYKINNLNQLHKKVLEQIWKTMIKTLMTWIFPTEKKYNLTKVHKMNKHLLYKIMCIKFEGVCGIKHKSKSLLLSTQ